MQSGQYRLLIKKGEQTKDRMNHLAVRGKGH